jgi:hypothetical protein
MFRFYRREMIYVLLVFTLYSLNCNMFLKLPLNLKLSFFTFNLLMILKVTSQLGEHQQNIRRIHSISLYRMYINSLHPTHMLIYTYTQKRTRLYTKSHHHNNSSYIYHKMKIILFLSLKYLR